MDEKDLEILERIMDFIDKMKENVGNLDKMKELFGKIETEDEINTAIAATVASLTNYKNEDIGVFMQSYIRLNEDVIVNTFDIIEDAFGEEGKIGRFTAWNKLIEANVDKLDATINIAISYIVEMRKNQKR